MAKLSLYEALNTALTRTKQYIDDNHYNQTEIDALLALKAEKNHGYHVPTPEAAQNNKFLRNDNTWYTVTLADLGAAAASHGTHVTFSTVAPAANSGSGSVGTATTVSRSDHAHPVQTSVSGNAGSANKVNNSMKVQLNGGTTEGTNQFTFDGSAAKTINITPSSIGAAASTHGTHVTYAQNVPSANGTAAIGSVNRVAREDHVHPLQTSVSGNAGSANKVNNSLVIKINGGTTEGTNMFTFDGSGAKTIDLKASALGSPASHNHDDRYYTESEMNTKLSTLESTAKSYTDTAITNLVNSAPDAMNTLKELADAIDAHQDVYEAYVEEMSTALAGKANSEHGVHVTYDDTNKPKVAGTAACGTSAKVARADHVHPVQTSVSGSSGSCTGNAATATKFASSQSVALTGDVTGSASSQAGWSVATTLSNSGVTAGSYGPSADASPAHKGTFTVPYITVDAKGRVTAASTKTITLPADNNTTYTNMSLGNGYGTCATEAGTTAKVVTLSNYALQTGGQVSVKFTYAVPASATMNINGKGAKNIYYKGAAITAGVIKAGDLATFIYDGTQYQLIAIDRWQADTAKSISGLSASGRTITYTKVDGSTGTITTQDTTYTHPTSGATAGSYGNSSAQTPGYGSTFNVPYITVDANGHITAISNQTVKIPASDKVTVTNNLTSTSTTNALSAYQGKLLQDNKVDKIEDTDLATLLDDIFGA